MGEMPQRGADRGGHDYQSVYTLDLLCCSIQENARAYRSDFASPETKAEGWPTFSICPPEAACMIKLYNRASRVHLQ